MDWKKDDLTLQNTETTGRKGATTGGRGCLGMPQDERDSENTAREDGWRKSQEGEIQELKEGAESSLLLEAKRGKEGRSFLKPKGNEKGSSLLEPKGSEKGSSFLESKGSEEGSSLLESKGSEEGSLFLVARDEATREQQKELLYEVLGPVFFGEKQAGSETELEQFFRRRYGIDIKNDFYEGDEHYEEYIEAQQAIAEGMSIYGGRIGFADNALAELAEQIWESMEKRNGGQFRRINTMLEE